MASKSTLSIVLFLSLNLVFFALVSGCDTCHNPNKPKASTKATCPVDTLQLGICANVLGGLLGVAVGQPPKKECCSLIQGLVDLEATVCLCTPIKADLLGIKLDIPVSVSLLLNACGKKVPRGYKCA